MGLNMVRFQTLIIEISLIAFDFSMLSLIFIFVLPPSLKVTIISSETTFVDVEVGRLGRLCGKIYNNYHVSPFFLHDSAY